MRGDDVSNCIPGCCRRSAGRRSFASFEASKTAHILVWLETETADIRMGNFPKTKQLTRGTLKLNFGMPGTAVQTANDLENCMEVPLSASSFGLLNGLEIALPAQLLGCFTQLAGLTVLLNCKTPSSENARQAEVSMLPQSFSERP